LGRYVQPFAEPDELIELDTVRSELITRAGMTVSHDTQQPGWRWSTHIRPLVKSEWCEVRHLGVLVRGHMHVLLSDGTEFDVGPVSLMDIPAGHDAWVVGDEPVETIAWSRVKDWLKPLDIMGERVLVTLIFTDLVDSTATAARLGRGIRRRPLPRGMIAPTASVDDHDEFRRGIDRVDAVGDHRRELGRFATNNTLTPR